MASAQEYKYPGIPGREYSDEVARESGDAINRAMGFIRDASPGAGSYSTEADYFLEDWQENQWGSNCPQLLEIKRTYDPDNFFRVHHGVGSEELSAGAFAQR